MFGPFKFDPVRNSQRVCNKFITSQNIVFATYVNITACLSQTPDLCLLFILNPLQKIPGLVKAPYLFLLYQIKFKVEAYKFMRQNKTDKYPRQIT